MRCSQFIYVFLFLGLLSQAGFAYDPVIMNCVETPEIYTAAENRPDQFSASNNLIRKSGSPLKAKGELIYITGRVVDIDCVPIQNVTVFIWQANNAGYYQTTKSAEASDADRNDPNFLGSGKFITDNLGNYNFVTIMPGRFSSDPPQINFLVQHPEFIDLETRMFFADQQPSAAKLSKSVDKGLVSLLFAPFTLSKDGVKIYHFDITLGGNNKYEQY